ncbi:MAG: PKD domain-containing protein [candidate division SR1 bacterium]|nr:PKD domain-containing protein [candidate division SR1 bacterium]
MADPFFPNTPMPGATPNTQQTPATTAAQPVIPRPVASAAGAQKPVSKISMKTFLIGCATLFMIIVGGATIIFYNLIKNPSQLTTLGINPATTKTLLQAFSAIFFGLLTFLGIGILITNLYRLVTVKNKPKTGYGLSAVGGFFLFIFGIAFGAQILTVVGNISVENILDSNKLIMPYIQLKDGVKYTRGDTTLKLIAPANMYYTLNTNYFNAQILPGLGQVNIPSMALDCGNGQTLPLNLTTRQFDGSCIYFDKGEFPLKLIVDYTNIATSEKLQKEIPAGSLIMDAKISITPSKGDLAFNDAKTEMSVGKVPSKVTFDASQAFKDLQLTDYKIIRDFNGDGTADKQNQANTTFVYKEAKLYNVTVRFPLLNNYIYTFPLRVEQSDVPVCEIAIQKNTEAGYSFKTTFLDNTTNISNFQFDILDTQSKGKVIDSIKSTSPDFNYDFPGKGTYAIQANYMTADGKQGQCESDDIQVGATDFQIFYDLNFKSPGSPDFQKVLATTDVSLDSGALMVKEIPTVIQLKINQITPATNTTTTKVLYDGKSVLSTNDKLFEVTLQDSNPHTITIVVEDKTRGTKTEEVIPVSINRVDIVGKLIVTPDTVGIDPFTVKFDASTTTLNDPADEIVYFSWDFGDGVIKKNLSESVVTHTYTYDATTDNGEYHPVLTIQTKKGRKINISPDNNIIVKRTNQELVIRIDSHPAQLANVNDRVSFSLQLNGLPTDINRDFGNGKTLKCQGRDCIQATQIYSTPGNYTIRAEAVFSGQPTIEGTIVLKVK